MAFLVYDQNHWWALKPDYTFGYIVPLFVAYIIYDRWPKIQAAASAPVAGPANPVFAGLLNFIAWSAVILGSIGFLFGAMLRASMPQQPASLAMAMGVGMITLGTIYLALPTGAGQPGGQKTEGKGGLFSNPRLLTASLFLFPAVIWLVSAPLLGVVETRLNLFLMNKVTVVVYNLFNFIGIPIIQEGNVLRLGDDNVVGVAEACSGIRSLTGCIFAGSFLAAAFLDRFWKQVLLLIAAALLAVFTNMLRSIFLTAWAYVYGSKAIEGTVHDVTGYAVLGVTCVLLLCLLPLFSLKLKVAAPDPASTP
jgi:exosortase/archaeosortase family protein